ncbi:hypothetical protein LSTR_LSTR002421 [Laodelphax striatellus]|uniref:SAM domain-containing protein n=1 Tax=Laodelphax striatellus TaxID=195883 RepID=A0A482X3A9_LAOST|nr:hypothetical protein LSTR_LSTR002421 [Laodelphax striatellus]
MARPAGYSSDDDSDFEGLYLNESDTEKDKPKFKGTSLSNDVAKPKGTLEQQLLEAVQTGNYEAVQDLLKNGAKVNYVENGWSALMYAALYSYVKILKLILENGGNAKFHRDFVTPIMVICNGLSSEDDKRECVRLIVQHGGDVNEVDRYRTSALMFAAKAGHAHLVRELIDLGARVNVVDKDGASALIYAVKDNRAEVVDVLLKAKADIKVRDRNNYSAFDYADMKNLQNLKEKLQFDVKTFSNSKYVNVMSSFTLEELLEEMPSRNRGGDLAGFPSDICQILCGMDLMSTAHVFYDNKIQLGEFLLMTDEKMKSLGVKLSYHRRKILESIRRFHMHRWLKSSIRYKPNNEKLNSIDCIKMVATVVRQLHVLQSSLMYLQQHLPREGLPEEALEILSKAAHQSQLLNSECGRIGEFATALEKRQKLVPVDLIENKPKAKSKKVIVISGIWLCAVGVVVWKKSYVMNSLQRVFVNSDGSKWAHVFN